MIYDKLAFLRRYFGSSQNLDRLIAFVENTDLRSLPLGKNEIWGEDVYVNHFTYSTSVFSDAHCFEAHEQYLDMHVLLSGRERIAVSPTEKLALQKELPEEDSVLYSGEAEQFVPMTPETFLLLYPGEGHSPKLSFDGPEAADKLVFKIRIG